MRQEDQIAGVVGQEGMAGSQIGLEKWGQGGPDG